MVMVMIMGIMRWNRQAVLDEGWYTVILFSWQIHPFSSEYQI